MKYLTFCFSLCVLFSCQFSNNTLVKRADQKILLVSDSEAIQKEENVVILNKLKATSEKMGIALDTALSFQLLDEDTLIDYAALVLLDFNENEMEAWNHSSVERYVEMGGGIILADTNQTTPYLWPFLDGFKKGTPKNAEKQEQEGDVISNISKFIAGAGRVAVPGFELADLEENSLEALVKFAIGDNQHDTSLASTPAAPKFDRYVKKILDDNIYEPMDLVVLPDLKVLFIERRGKMKLYSPTKKKTSTVAEFDVCIDGNYEDGLTGMELDPGYGKDNHWVYIYYSPGADCKIQDQYLSRFVFKDDSLHWETEKVVLKVMVQRETCCHSGGCVKFGPDGLLYLSTGDNTSSKESDGMTPIDERPGRGPFDAQKSSANTHDLRGKILRIKPEADGTYSIPDGNLFPKDGSNGRPEIYAMGCRSPFRIAIDPATNWLYWGDVGPDAGGASKYGPDSNDEWNQAKEAGFFGWPYFMGDNFAFPDRNFETDEIGPLFDPAKPINDSPNNYGSKELPPAQPAWVWYPYGDSKEFPLLGIGSRSSMAGPFYYPEEHWPLSMTKFPDYYEGKFFAYEWARSWIQAWTIDKETGELLKMEPFLPDMPISKPIDIKFGPDGALYMLEYGKNYFMNNPDAVLSRIEYAKGNRPPIPSLQVDNANGAAPHTVQFSALGSFDYDVEDSTLTYEWHFTDFNNVQASGEAVVFTFDEAGVYNPVLKVTDTNGATKELSTKIQVGNAPPEVQFAYKENGSFFFNQNQLGYNVSISDKEDGQGVDPTRALVNLSWVGDSEYLNQLRRGHANLPDAPLKYVEGIRLIQGSDCSSCHHETKKNIGPSFKQIAEYYKGQFEGELVPHLARKIVKGGGGVWGDKLMAGHPQLTQKQAEMMTRYILSLEDVERLPLNGNFQLNQHSTENNSGGYVLSAAYKDEGANGIEALTGRTIQILRHPKVEAEDHDGNHLGLEGRFGPNRDKTQVHVKSGGWLSFKNIDLKNIRSLSVQMIHQVPGTLELHTDSPNGPVIGSRSVQQSTTKNDWRSFNIPINASNSQEDLFLVFNGATGNATTKTGDNIQPYLWHIDWVLFKK